LYKQLAVRAAGSLQLKKKSVCVIGRLESSDIRSQRSESRQCSSVQETVTRKQPREEVGRWRLELGMWILEDLSWGLKKFQGNSSVSRRRICVWLYMCCNTAILEVCRIAFVLWSTVIESGCNQRANKIQSSELRPVISSRVILKGKGLKWILVEHQTSRYKGKKGWQIYEPSRVYSSSSNGTN
jgi:hypothetical protein